MKGDDDDDHLDKDDRPEGRRSDPDVGYGRPPKATQFKPGQSGNPNGRPRGAKTRRFAGGGYFLRDPLVAELERLIPVRDGGQEVMMSQMQAIARQMAIKSLQGNVRAAELLFKHAATIQRVEQRKNERFMETMATYKAAADAEVKRRRARGITDMSDILPHPDHVDVDFVTGEVLISGPMSARERDAIEAGHAVLENRRQALADLDALAVETLPAGLRQQLLEARRQIEAEIQAYAEALGEADP